MQTQAMTNGVSAGRHKRGTGLIGLLSSRITRIVPAAIGALLTIVPVVPSAGAEQVGGVMLSGQQEGKITSVQGNKVVLNGTAYELDPDIEVLDSEGVRLEPSSIAPRAKARIQVKREQPNRIVKMVLTLPQ